MLNQCASQLNMVHRNVQVIWIWCMDALIIIKFQTAKNIRHLGTLGDSLWRLIDFAKSCKKIWTDLVYFDRHFPENGGHWRTSFAAWGAPIGSFILFFVTSARLRFCKQKAACRIGHWRKARYALNSQFMPQAQCIYIPSRAYKCILYMYIILVESAKINWTTQSVGYPP